MRYFGYFKIGEIEICLLKSLDVAFAPLVGGHPSLDIERNTLIIIDYYRKGIKAAQLARKYKLSRQRIGQIIITYDKRQAHPRHFGKMVNRFHFSDEIRNNSLDWKNEVDKMLCLFHELSRYEQHEEQIIVKDYINGIKIFLFYKVIFIEKLKTVKERLITISLLNYFKEDTKYFCQLLIWFYIYLSRIKVISTKARLKTGYLLLPGFVQLSSGSRYNQTLQWSVTRGYHYGKE